MLSFAPRTIVEKHIKAGIFDQWISDNNGCDYDIRITEQQTGLWIEVVANDLCYKFRYNRNYTLPYSDDCLEYCYTKDFGLED